MRTPAIHALVPGFAREWQDCVNPMRAIIQHLLAYEADDDEILICLMTDFPNLRSEADYRGVFEQEKMRVNSEPEARIKAADHKKKRRDYPIQRRDEPDDFELQVATCISDLIRLASLYDIEITPDPEADELVLSRKIVVGGPLWSALRQYKRQLMTGLTRHLAAVH